jgi:hypothetical protein
VDEQGVLIAGHGRVAAAAKLGLMVPIPVMGHWQLSAATFDRRCKRGTS